MEYWAVLWVTVLSGPLENSTSGLIYKSLDQCEAAINTVAGTITGQYDYQIYCEESYTPSSSIRPKRRPEGLTNE